MRLGLIILLCLSITGCGILRRDREEPVENGPRPHKVEPVLKPSEALRPPSLEIASPITDHFYMRGTYFLGSVDTVFRIDPSSAIQGSTLSGEDDLGLDDQVDQGRMEFDIRLEKRHHVRIDFFKLNRFSEQPLENPIIFGDFIYPAGTNFRTKLDWRDLSLTHTYSFFISDRFEIGGGLGFHIIEVHAEGGQPGTTKREQASEVGVIPTIALSGTYRVSKLWSVNAHAQYFKANIDDFSGELGDYHADVQYRWKRNLAIGLGYSKLSTHIELVDDNEPLLFDIDTGGPELFFRVSF